MRRSSGATKHRDVRRAVEWALFGLLGAATAWSGGACTLSFPDNGTGVGGGSLHSAGSGWSTGNTGSGDATTVGSGVSTCDIVDGVCSLMAGEDCGCVDCAGTAICNPDQCVTDQVCDPLDDSCICPDCDNTHYCGDPAKKNCVDDGVCDSFYEGCGCADCGGKPHCAELLATCAGGHLDGVCAKGEPCSCPDCFGLAQCVACPSPDACSPGDPCSCPGCAATPVCSDLAGCVDDGVCDILDEGCVCGDCMTTLACQTGAGTTGTGATGSGSSGATTGSSSGAGP